VQGVDGAIRASQPALAHGAHDADCGIAGADPRGAAHYVAGDSRK